ncbi:MAG TPA: ABC transporter substrate-binding protein [Acetobacteraceae bacterium]|nr:ABC transporter substrate-binding protein [Acetobacteraceae bacterium]
MRCPFAPTPFVQLVAGAAILLLAVPALAANPTEGVTATQITIGTTTDLSGVTAVQGVNNADAIRMVFDDANKAGGVNGRKIRYIVEDTQYTVPRAVQAINKLLNLNHVFFTIADGGTPMNDAEMPMEFAKGVPNVFPLSGARSMFEPYNRLKFGQFASYYDEMRAGVKYFVAQKHVKKICALYQDSDFGQDVYAGIAAEAKALNMPVVATATDHPTDTDFTATLAKLRDAGCDFVGLGTIVRDTIDILSQAGKMGWHPDFVGQIASYDTAVATAPGGIANGFYSMTPAIYAYPDDPRPAVQKFAAEYKKRFGIDPNFLGEQGYTAAHIVLLALKRAGPHLTTDSFIHAMESIHDYHDIFGTTLSLGPHQHHAETAAFLAVVKNGRWVPVTEHQLAY